MFNRKIRNNEKVDNDEKEISNEKDIETSDKLDELILEFLNNCFLRTHTMATLKTEDKNFCESLVKNYTVFLNDYSVFQLNRFISYSKINSIVQFELTRILSNHDLRSSLNSYINEYENEINEHITALIAKKGITNFSVSDIKWINYSITYIKNQVSIYSIVMDEADGSFSEREEIMNANIEKTKLDFKNSVEEKTKKMNEDTQRAISEAQGVLPHLLTVISLFVSVIIAVVAVYLNDLISIKGIENYISPQMLILRYVVSGHIIMNIVILFLYMAARMTDKTILIRCPHFVNAQNSPLTSEELKYYRPCALCENRHNCKTIFKLWNKALHIIILNVVFIISYAIIFEWWVISRYIKNNLEYLLNDNLKFMFNGDNLLIGIIYSAITLIVVFAIIFTIYKIINKSYKVFNRNRYKSIVDSIDDIINLIKKSNNKSGTDYKSKIENCIAEINGFCTNSKIKINKAKYKNIKIKKHFNDIKKDIEKADEGLFEQIKEQIIKECS